MADGPVEGPWALPAGWRWERLGNLAHINPPRSLHHLRDDSEVAFVPMAAVEAESGRISLAQTRRAEQVRQGFTRFRSGDVLFAKITPCMENGKIAVVPELVSDLGCGSTEFHVIAPVSLESKFLYFWINQRFFRREAEFRMTGSAGQKRVPAQFMRDAPVPVPPRDVQHHIVARIEELLTDLDDGEALLARARDDLTTWRKALLKAAVTGELTAEWRAANPPAETGVDLLARILDERRRDGAKAKAKYTEPKSLRCQNLSELPHGWAWATIEQLCAAARPVAYGVLQPGADVGGGTALVRVMDIADGRVAINQLKKIDHQVARQYPRTALRGGEVLLTVVGSIGRTALVPKELVGANTARAVAVLAVKYASAEWVELCLRFEPYRAALESSAHEVARKTLNLEDVRVFPIPVPPLAEQAELVRLARSEIQVGNDTQASMIDAREAASALRQSILSAAFRGDLVA